MPITNLISQLESAIRELGPLTSGGPTGASMLVIHGRDDQAVVGAHRSDPALAALRTSPVPVLYAPEYVRPSDGPLRLFAPVDFMRGTEPLLRVYAEAPDAKTLARRLRAGVRLLERASGR